MPVGVADALRAASHEVGFLYVSNHGVDPGLLKQARETALEFFRLDESTKQEVAINQYHRGWLGPGQARMETDSEPDLKESFVWGPEPDGAGVAHPLRGNNRWPEGLRCFKQTAVALSQALEALARRLLGGFALGLGLNEDAFVATSDQPLSRTSFVYYPPQAARARSEQFGVAPHTDFGVLTVLCQDGVGGLQVQAPGGQWVTAPPIPGTLVVNVGDLLARWTNGYYRSTPHRVINDSGLERLSLVHAFDPNPETLVDAGAVFADDAPACAPITCGDYLVERFARSFDYRRRAS